MLHGRRAGTDPGHHRSVQAVETLKLLAGFGDTMTGRLLLLDGASMEWHSVRLKRNPKCTVCADRPWPDELKRPRACLQPV